MKHLTILSAIALTTAAFGGIASASPASDTAESENWLQIPAIYNSVEAAGFTNIREIERESKGYEVKASNAEGQKVKLYVDPLSGEIIDSRSKGEKMEKNDSRQGEASRR